MELTVYYYHVPGLMDETVPYHDWKKQVGEMERWCREQGFKQWGRSIDTFRFYSERDYALFLLRWA